MNRRSLNIAFIGGRGVGGTYSGIETYYEEVGSRLVERGHRVTAYCRRHFTPDVQRYRGIEVRRLPSWQSKHLDTFTHSLVSTVDALRRAYDVIQYHAIGSAPLSLLPRLWGGKTVLSVRGLDWQRAKWGLLARGFLQFGEWASVACPSATVVVSSTLQRHYAEQHGAWAHFIPNAVPPPTLRSPERIRAWGLDRDGFVLYAGRLSPEKGVHTLLEALRPLDLHGKRLVLAGGSSHTGGYIERLKRDAWDGVLFTGSVDHDTMQELYTNCYAYVLPSVMEGLSVGLLEALSYGACIVTTDIPENREVVGEAALCVPANDVGALRRELREVLDSPLVVHARRELARARAQGQPGWDEIAQMTEALYYRVLDGSLQGGELPFRSGRSPRAA